MAKKSVHPSLIDMDDWARPGFIRTLYDGSDVAARAATDVHFLPPEEEEFSAQQQFKDDCDLNLIVERAQKNGDFGYFEQFKDRVIKGQYLDLVGFPDYREAQGIILEANAAFMDLPAKVRKEFDNDPAKFLDHIDKADRVEFERLGLIPPQDLTSEEIPFEVPEPSKKNSPPTGDDKAS